MPVIIAVLKVIGIILAALFALLMFVVIVLLLTRVDLSVKYSESGFLVRVSAWGIKFTLYPFKKSEKKIRSERKKKSEPASETEEDEVEEKGGKISEYTAYLSPVLDALKGALRSIFVKRLRVRFTAANGEDPAAAALQYGRAWAVAGSLTPLFEACRNVKSYSYNIEIDYDAPSPRLYFYILLRAPVWRFVIVGIRFLWEAYKIRKEKRKQK